VRYSVRFYSFFAQLNLPKVKAAFAEEMGRARNEGFTAQEIEAAKKALIEERRIARAQDAELASKLVTQDFLGRNWDDETRIDRAIEATTLAQANEALRTYITPATMAEVFAGDFARR
jgi:zinc protease